MVESALIVSTADLAFLSEMLSSFVINQITTLSSCSEARKLLFERDFDLVIINAPLRDETGEKLSRDIAVKGASQVILIVKSEYFDAMCAVCEDDGVLVVAKPTNRAVFRSALALAKSAQNRAKRAYAENEKLKQKIEDIKIIDRAKWILVSYMNMNEQDAHRYMEKEAMDKRATKRSIAEEILRTYEN